ncbi:dephospho-CoA kinase [Hoylesella oralis]|uniref:dephospho-CoA kinase n=1 Tax=Hoylesella oralis TaxID=28134 RepID=UPI0028E337CD|nr:dephospho-CoA kinase [Hoylesella oralis]
MVNSPKVAITGGIGSGKTHVCRLLEERGIRVYDCDEAAKRLMQTSEELQRKLKNLVGSGVYINKVLQKSVLAKFLLASNQNKQAVNDIVHPAVASDFETSGYCWLESAILFESGFFRRTHFDFAVCVTAPLETRVARVMARDGISRTRALAWINSQMAQEEMLKLSDFEIVNNGESDVNIQISNILKQINNTNH